MLASQALDREIDLLESGSNLLDVGCGECESLTSISMLRPDLQLHGCDRQSPNSVPAKVRFATTDFRHQALPYGNDAFALVICQHVIEHLTNPVEFVGEMLRVLAPGGRLFIETPSNYSCLVSYPYSQDRCFILNFYDDPTHVGRPWTPQALFRLAHYYSCTPLVARYEFSWISVLKLLPAYAAALVSGKSDRFIETFWRATGWITFAVIEKHADCKGTPPFNYFTFRGKAPRALK